jgi:hypothetical protein
MEYLLHSLTYNSLIFSYNHATNSSAGEKSSSRIISMVMFYEQPQRGCNLLTVYLSAGFEFFFYECNFSWLHKYYPYVHCLPPMNHQCPHLPDP